MCVFNLFFQTWRSEGFLALYKGFFPNWLRLGPWNIIVSFQHLISAAPAHCVSDVMQCLLELEKGS